MKAIVPVLIGALFLLCSGTVWADMPLFEDWGRIQDGSGDIKVGYDSTPTVVDWNNDGMKDLICGQYTSGNIWLYLNQGTNLNPVFVAGSRIESNGTPITTTYG